MASSVDFQNVQTHNDFLHSTTPQQALHLHYQTQHRINSNHLHTTSTTTKEWPFPLSLSTLPDYSPSTQVLALVTTVDLAQNLIYVSTGQKFLPTLTSTAIIDTVADLPPEFLARNQQSSQSGTDSVFSSNNGDINKDNGNWVKDGKKWIATDHESRTFIGQNGRFVPQNSQNNHSVQSELNNSRCNGQFSTNGLGLNGSFDDIDISSQSSRQNSSNVSNNQLGVETGQIDQISQMSQLSSQLNSNHNNNDQNVINSGSTSVIPPSMNKPTTPITSTTPTTTMGDQFDSNTFRAKINTLLENHLKQRIIRSQSPQGIQKSSGNNNNNTNRQLYNIYNAFFQLLSNNTVGDQKNKDQNQNTIPIRPDHTIPISPSTISTLPLTLLTMGSSTAVNIPQKRLRRSFFINFFHFLSTELKSQFILQQFETPRAYNTYKFSSTTLESLTLGAIPHLAPNLNQNWLSLSLREPQMVVNLNLQKYTKNSLRGLGVSINDLEQFNHGGQNGTPNDQNSAQNEQFGESQTENVGKFCNLQTPLRSSHLQDYNQFNQVSTHQTSSKNTQTDTFGMDNGITTNDDNNGDENDDNDSTSSLIATNLLQSTHDDDYYDVETAQNTSINASNLSKLQQRSQISMKIQQNSMLDWVGSDNVFKYTQKRSKGTNNQQNLSFNSQIILNLLPVTTISTTKQFNALYYINVLNRLLLQFGDKKQKRTFYSLLSNNNTNNSNQNQSTPANNSVFNVGSLKKQPLSSTLSMYGGMSTQFSHSRHNDNNFDDNDQFDLNFANDGIKRTNRSTHQQQTTSHSSLQPQNMSHKASSALYQTMVNTSSLYHNKAQSNSNYPLNSSSGAHNNQLNQYALSPVTSYNSSKIVGSSNTIPPINTVNNSVHRISNAETSPTALSPRRYSATSSLTNISPISTTTSMNSANNNNNQNTQNINNSMIDGSLDGNSDAYHDAYSTTTGLSYNPTSTVANIQFNVQNNNDNGVLVDSSPTTSPKQYLIGTYNHLNSMNGGSNRGSRVSSPASSPNRQQNAIYVPTSHTMGPKPAIINTSNNNNNNSSNESDNKTFSTTTDDYNEMSQLRQHRDYYNKNTNRPSVVTPTTTASFSNSNQDNIILSSISRSNHHSEATSPSTSPPMNGNGGINSSPYTPLRTNQHNRNNADNQSTNINCQQNNNNDNYINTNDANNNNNQNIKQIETPHPSLGLFKQTSLPPLTYSSYTYPNTLSHFVSPSHSFSYLESIHNSAIEKTLLQSYMINPYSSLLAFQSGHVGAQSTSFQQSVVGFEQQQPLDLIDLSGGNSSQSDDNHASLSRITSVNDGNNNNNNVNNNNNNNNNTNITNSLTNVIQTAPHSPQLQSSNSIHGTTSLSLTLSAQKSSFHQQSTKQQQQSTLTTTNSSTVTKVSNKPIIPLFPWSIRDTYRRVRIVLLRRWVLVSVSKGLKLLQNAYTPLFHPQDHELYSSLPKFTHGLGGNALLRARKCFHHASSLLPGLITSSPTVSIPSANTQEHSQHMTMMTGHVVPQQVDIANTLLIFSPHQLSISVAKQQLQRLFATPDSPIPSISLLLCAAFIFYTIYVCDYYLSQTPHAQQSQPAGNKKDQQQQPQQQFDIITPLSQCYSALLLIRYILKYKYNIDPTNHHVNLRSGISSEFDKLLYQRRIEQYSNDIRRQEQITNDAIDREQESMVLSKLLFQYHSNFDDIDQLFDEGSENSSGAGNSPNIHVPGGEAAPFTTESGQLSLESDEKYSINNSNFGIYNHNNDDSIDANDIILDDNTVYNNGFNEDIYYDDPNNNSSNTNDNDLNENDVQTQSTLHSSQLSKQTPKRHLSVLNKAQQQYNQQFNPNNNRGFSNLNKPPSPPFGTSSLPQYPFNSKAYITNTLANTLDLSADELKLRKKYTIWEDITYLCMLCERQLFEYCGPW
jgi:hypothetical protein